MCEQDGGEHGILVILIGSEELLARHVRLVLSDQLSIIGNRRYATNTIRLNRFDSIGDQRRPISLLINRNSYASYFVFLSFNRLVLNNQ